MAEQKHSHVTYTGRHTAKSDQRFDANQRRDISTTISGENDGTNIASSDKKSESTRKITERHYKEEIKVEITGRNHLEPKDEMKILKNWGLLKKTLVLGHIVDPLIEKGILTPEKWMSLKTNSRAEQDNVEEFLYHILKCKHDAYGSFIGALRSRGYSHVANQLEGNNGEDHVPYTSLSSNSSSQNRQIGRPQNMRSMLPLQNVKVLDPRNGASMDHRTDSSLVETNPVRTRDIPEQASSGPVAYDSVRKEDLYRMKEEISSELRQLRDNIEKDRDDDRLELKLLQRKHTELQEDLAKTVGDREHLQKELTCVTDTVKVLKSQVEEKQNEYKEVKEKNKHLEEQLEKREGHLETQIKKREEEKNELVMKLKAKDEEYKRLQRMLERLKQEHEDRHTRLKGLTKDKVTFEKEVQLLNKERKNLEVKIKSLEQHIRTLQENHAREIGDLKRQLEKYKALMKEKDKERGELEKRLEKSERKNENFKKATQDLEDNLQKSQDENAHLQQRLHKADMSRFALPPFLAGSKSKRTGWNPKNLRR